MYLLFNMYRAYVWEVLKNTLSKVNSRVAQVKAKLDNLQSIHEVNKAKRSESEATESKKNKLQCNVMLTSLISD